jgi:sporulation protein YlmC with PRC-barrel domain
MNLDINTSVRYPSGEETGTIARVVIMPADGTVQSVVLITPGVTSREVVVPVGMLSTAPGDVVQFDGDAAALDALPNYIEAEYVRPPEDGAVPGDYLPGSILFPLNAMDSFLPVTEYENIPEGSVTLSQGTAVVCQDGVRAGVVDEVELDAEGQLTGLIVRPDEPGTPDFRVAIGLIAGVSDAAVTLTCTFAELPERAEPLVEETEEPEPRRLI